MHRKNYKDSQKINPRQYMFTIQENLKEKTPWTNMEHGII